MRRRVLAATAAVLLAGLAATMPAAAQIRHAAAVSANPVDFTPHVLDGEVRALALVGETVVVGGDFSRVSDASGKVVYQRPNIFAYDQRSGHVIETFNPKVDGPVLALAEGAGSVYLGGSFLKVNDAAARGLAQVDVASGALVAGFRAPINWGDVRSLVASGPWLYAAGTFSRIGTVPRVGLARLSAATGAVDANFDLRLAAPHLTRVKVDDIALSPDGTKLVAIGGLEQVGGQYRAQVAMIEAAAVPARVTDWYTDAYTKPCRAGFETYVRAVDFSPTGDYFAIVATGRMSGLQRMCDTVARFETAGTGLHRPTWVNHTGGDSLYSVSITGSAVYVGGHQRWMNNPYGHESAGRGAVSRPGIAAVDPANGLALPWNPGRQPRGVGARALLATPAGLLVGSDTAGLAKEYHARLGMFPLA